MYPINPYIHGGAGSLQVWLDPELWLDGENPLNTNSRWYDKSKNNYLIQQTTVGNQPQLSTNLINGRAGYVFNGNSSYFDGGDILDLSVDEWTIVAVFNKYTTADGSLLAKSAYNDLSHRYYVAVTSSNISFFTQNHFNQKEEVITSLGATSIKTIFNKYNASPYTLLFRKFGQSIDTLVTGSQAQPVYPPYPYNSNFKFLIGAYNSILGGIPPVSGLYFNGAICEIIMYKRIIQGNELVILNNYLYNKYNL